MSDPFWIITQPEAFEAAIAYWQAMGWTVHIHLKPDFTLAQASSEQQACAELTARTSEGNPVSDRLLVTIPYAAQLEEQQEVVEAIASHYDLQVLD